MVKSVYEVRFNFPYEGHASHGHYTSKSKAKKRAKALVEKHRPNYDWIDVVEHAIGDSDAYTEKVVWTSES